MLIIWHLVSVLCKSLQCAHRARIVHHLLWQVLPCEIMLGKSQRNPWLHLRVEGRPAGIESQGHGVRCDGPDIIISGLAL